MKKEHLLLLGKIVKPIVKRTAYIDPNTFTLGAHEYLKEKERHQMVSSGAKHFWKEQRRENREQQWTVWSIHADGTFDLLSDSGYSQDNVSRSDFRLINIKQKS